MILLVLVYHKNALDFDSGILRSTSISKGSFSGSFSGSVSSSVSGNARPPASPGKFVIPPAPTAVASKSALAATQAAAAVAVNPTVQTSHAIETFQPSSTVNNATSGQQQSASEYSPVAPSQISSAAVLSFKYHPAPPSDARPSDTPSVAKQQQHDILQIPELSIPAAAAIPHNVPDSAQMAQPSAPFVFIPKEALPSNSGSVPVSTSVLQNPPAVANSPAKVC